MAQVTIELRHLLQMDDFNLFDFDYPISDPTWKEELERDIINYFYFHEIGSETPDRFKWQFKTRMLLIMPKYVKLYDALQGVNPLATLQVIEKSTDKTTSSGSSTTSSNTNTQADDVRTDYPDHADISNDIPSEKTRSTTLNNTSTNNTNTAEADREGELKREGYQGEVSDLVQNYYKNMKTINMMIIEELKDLFILVY